MLSAYTGVRLYFSIVSGFSKWASVRGARDLTQRWLVTIDFTATVGDVKLCSGSWDVHLHGGGGWDVQLYSGGLVIFNHYGRTAHDGAEQEVAMFVPGRSSCSLGQLMLVRLQSSGPDYFAGDLNVPLCTS